MTGTSPDASVSDTSVWQLAFFPKVEAYCGAPAESSAEEGRETFETLADLLVELIREVAP